MKKLNQKGFEHLTIIGIALVLVLVAGIGYYVWSKRDTASQTDQSTVVKTEEQTTQETNPIPGGYVEYSNTDLGLKFAYPEGWGEPIQISSSDSIITLAFPNTKVPDGTNSISGDGGYDVVLYANNGKQDFTTGGRGGALWDCVGFQSTTDGYKCKNINIVNGEKQNTTGQTVSDAELVKSVNSEVLLGGYNYFFDDVYGAFINLNKDYYGALIVTQGSSTSYKDQLKVLASTVEVTN